MTSDKTLAMRLKREWSQTVPLSLEELLASKAATQHHRDYLEKVKRDETKFYAEAFRIKEVTEGEICFVTVQFLLDNGYIVARSPVPGLDDAMRRNPHWGKTIFAASVDNTHASFYNISYHKETSIAVVLSSINQLEILPDRKG